MLATPLVIVIELARAQRAEDPFAFRFEPQDYVVRGEGGGFSRIHLDWDQRWLDDLAALRRPGRPPELLQRLGERLRRVLEGAGWAAKAAAIDGVLRAGGRVVVTIRSAAAELYTLPWELLTLGPSGQHLAELDGVLLRYEWPETQTRPEVDPPREADGRILVAWSAAGGAVPAAEHVAAIQAACEAGGRRFDPERDVIAHASAERLEAALEDALEAASRRGPAIDVLHVLCHAHGGPSGGLLLDADDGAGTQTIDPGSLRRLLGRFAGMLRLVVFAACESADPGAAPGLGSLGSLAQVVHRAGVAAVIGARVPLAVDASITFTRALYRGLAVELRSLEGAVLEARRELAQTPGGIAWATLQLYSRAADGEDSRPLIVRPYRGLLAFEPRHRRLLFGRDRESAEIRGDLRGLETSGRPQLLVVAGASGTGKSSVVLGGFVPALLEEREPTWSWERMRPGTSPLCALAAAASRLTGAAVASDPAAIFTALHGWREGHPERALLLVVDQLEELFTQGSAAPEREAFVRLLWRLASDRRWPVAIICTIRVDFVGRCGEIAVDDDDTRLDRIAYDENHRVFIARGDRSLLREVIERPAAAVGLSFEPGLIERILDDVAGEPGALPLLGHALDLLWAHRSGRVLTLAVYREIGEIGGALSRHADTIVDALSGDERAQARRLLVRLVSASGTLDARARLPVRRLRPSGASAAIFDAALGRLTAGRLLVLRDAERVAQDGAEDGAKDDEDEAADEAAGATVEVAHEALLRAWARLQAWIAEDQQRIRDLARIDAWIVDFEERGTLLDDARLAFARDYAERSPDDFDARARALLDASEAARDAARRREAERRAELERSLRRARRNLVVAGAVAGLALLLAVFATDAIEEVEREGQRRTDDPLLALVDQLPETAHDLRLSVLAAVAEPRDRADWSAAADATLGAIPEQHVLADLEGAPIHQLDLSPDDAQLLVLSDLGPRLVAPPSDSERSTPVSTQLQLFVEAGANYDSESAYLVLDSGDLLHWDYHVGDQAVVRAGLRGDVLAIQAHWLTALLRDDAAIHVIDLGPAGDVTTATFAAAVGDLAFVDAEQAYVATTADGAVHLRSLVEGSDADFTSPGGIPITARVFDRALLAITDRGEAITWSIDQPADAPTIRDLGHPRVDLARLDPTGTRALLASGADLWIENLDGTRSIALPGLRGPITAMTWTAAGDRVIASAGTQARIFAADGRRFDLADAPEARLEAVWSLAHCLDSGELSNLFNAHGLGLVKGSVDARNCGRNKNRLNQEPEPPPGGELYFAIFFFELGLLGLRLLRLRIAHGLSPTRADLLARAPGFVLTLLSLAAVFQVQHGAIGQGTQGPGVDTVALTALLTIWGIPRLVGLVGAVRRLRRLRRLALFVTGVGLAVIAAVYVFIWFLVSDQLVYTITTTTLRDGLNIQEVTAAMYYLLVAISAGLLLFALRLSDRADAAALAAAAELVAELPARPQPER